VVRECSFDGAMKKGEGRWGFLIFEWGGLDVFIIDGPKNTDGKRGVLEA